MCLTEYLLKLGPPDNANQSDDRTETKDSNSFKSSKLNVSCKTMKSQLICCDPYATSCYFILDFTFIITMNSLEWLFSTAIVWPHKLSFYGCWLKRNCRIIDFDTFLQNKFCSWCLSMFLFLHNFRLSSMQPTMKFTTQFLEKRMRSPSQQLQYISELPFSVITSSSKIQTKFFFPCFKASACKITQAKTKDDGIIEASHGWNILRHFI